MVELLLLPHRVSEATLPHTLSIPHLPLAGTVRIIIIIIITAAVAVLGVRNPVGVIRPRERIDPVRDLPGQQR